MGCRCTRCHAVNNADRETINDQTVLLASRSADGPANALDSKPANPRCCIARSHPAR
jgi:hypothetical protein